MICSAIFRMRRIEKYVIRSSVLRNIGFSDQLSINTVNIEREINNDNDISET